MFDQWIIQENIFLEEGVPKLIKILQERAIPYQEIKFIPHTSGMHFSQRIIPHDFVPAQNVVVLGGVSFLKMALSENWGPGIFMNDFHSFKYLKENWGKRMLNFESQVVKFKDVPKNLNEFFIRPVDGDKAFDGKPMTLEEFNSFQQTVYDGNWFTHLNGETEVVVSPIQKIYRETRFFVVDGQIVTGSVNKMNHREYYSANLPDQMLKYAQKSIEIWQPDRAFVIDIAETDHGCRIVETNYFNCAGFYKSDMNKIVTALENMVF